MNCSVMKVSIANYMLSYRLSFCRCIIIIYVMNSIFYYGLLHVISVSFNVQGSLCLLNDRRSEDDQEVSLRRRGAEGFGGPRLHKVRRADLFTTYVWL